MNGWVLHVIVGTIAAADSVFHRSGYGASAHFGVGKDGQVYQWVDTDDRAWAEGAGNPYWLSVETEGQPSEPLTNAQVASVARLMQWGQVHGPYPYAVTDSTSGRGLGVHVMGGAAWGGHNCPGPIRAAQRSLIVQAAVGGAPVPDPGPQPAPRRFEEEDVAVISPGQKLAIPVSLFARPGRAAVTVDTLGGAPVPSRVVAGKPGGWYAPFGAEHPGISTGTWSWDVHKDDQLVSIINDAKPIDPVHPELGPNITAVFEPA